MKLSYKLLSACLLAGLLCTMPLTNISEAAVNLKVNSRGNSVTLLQHRLQELKFSITSVDGIYGPETKSAVMAFQKSQRLPQTGIVDSTTWNKLTAVLKQTGTTKKKTVTQTKRISSSKNQLKPPAVIVSNAKPLPANTSAIIATAKKYTGTPYKFGGTTPSGFDCSGYTQYVFKQHNITIPRTADSQCTAGKYVSKSSLQPGDLVFFATKKDIEHCGIYVGDNSFIHASSSKGIRTDKLNDVYWGPKYYGARRIL